MRMTKIRGDNVFTGFLELLRVKHTKEFSNRYFNEHPHKYNLLGISKMLSDYGVENAGTRIENKAEDIFKIELPFIAHTISDFIVVHTIEKGKVHCLWNSKELAVPVSSFMEVWSGIVLLAEAAPNSIEPDYKEHKKQELLGLGQKILLSAAIGLVLVSAYLYNALFQNIGLNLLLLLNLTGIYTGYLLVLKQLHIHSRYADKICSLFSQSDCNNILELKAAKLWGVFGWSEIGLGYFVACSFTILFLPHLIPYLVVVNILALPYSLWSIWYQKFKAKQWCVLCLIVQALFWLVFVVELVFGYIQIPDFNIINWLFIGCLFAISILVVNILIPKLSGKRLVSYFKQEISSIKADEDVFRSLLKKRPRYEVSKSDSGIIFGNQDTQLFITIVSNPYCNPCAFMHKRVESLLKNTDGKVCIQYILSAFSEELENINKYMIAVSLEKDWKKTIQIFGEWFGKGKSLGTDFFSSFQLNMNNPEIEAEFEKHKAWMKRTQIRATPTILINGYQLPDNYQIENLQYFTEFNVDVK